jgi:hypothetical protein
MDYPIILPSASTQKNHNNIYNQYHRKAAPSAIEIGLTSGQLHPQKIQEPSQTIDSWINVFFHHPPLCLHVLPSIPYVLWAIEQGLTGLKHNKYPLRTCSSKSQSTQAVGPDLVRTANAPSHAQGCVCC